MNDHAVPVMEREESSQAYTFSFLETGREVMTKGRTPELLLALVIAAKERLQRKLDGARVKEVDDEKMVRAIKLSRKLFQAH